MPARLLGFQGTAFIGQRGRRGKRKRNPRKEIKN
jgi:hypothetical protein